MRLRFLLLTLLPAFIYIQSYAQQHDYLNKKVSLHVKNKSVNTVLKSIEAQGAFSFSYSSNLLPADSLVSLNTDDQTIASVLKRLFGNRFEYRERESHIIILPASMSSYKIVNGYISDNNTGMPVAYASVYTPGSLAATMTDEHGYFRLQIKEPKRNDSVVVSKLSYWDTAFALSSVTGLLHFSITPLSYAIDSVTITNNVEHNWLAKRLLPTKQIINSLNLNHFFVKQPLQFSLVPGLGSHGKLGSQVINKFSLNIVGGYGAGVNGFELGAGFNIVKQDVRFVQMAGLFNIVGGNVRGVQVGGLYNNVRSTVHGFQAGGLVNTVKDSMLGVQVGGICNKVTHIKGVQVAGLINKDKGNAHGVIIAGFYNKSKSSRGLQIAGFANITQASKGLQIGAVNIADTNLGYSIGLVNISRTGYHKLSVSYNEMGMLSLAYKSGNPRLYSVLSGLVALDADKKAYGIGYGVGSDLRISARKLYFNPELTSLYIYNGLASNQNLLWRLQLNIKYRINKNCAFYAGPAGTLLYAHSFTAPDGYRSDFTGGMPVFHISNRLKGWIGWRIGLDIF